VSTDPRASRPADGVLLMTYGSPSSLDDVPRYMTAVRGGRAPEPELVEEFRRRYEVIGGSPLIPRTIEQADALEERLGGTIPVRAAMRFSSPGIDEALAEMTGLGVRRVLGIVLSPQYSPLLMSGYAKALEAARDEIGPGAPDVRVADAWHEQPAFLDALAERIRDAVDRLPPEERERAPVLLTAHSLPRHVAEREPGYLHQLERTAEEVARRAGVERERWTFCWQSAGHEPGEWMKPDFADLMPLLAAEGRRSVVVAPVQFLSDHLEILYDVDIGAREQAEEAGLRFTRIRTLGTHPGLIEALAEVVRSELVAAPA
jgi:protoporphyrin/coproporphyrin ferrochelatase